MTTQFIIRKLQKEDYHNNYLDLLRHLSIINPDNISYTDFCKWIDSLKSDIFVIVDTLNNNKLVGSGTVIIEPKFIHDLSSVGHIEDIVIAPDYRDRGLGKLLINNLVENAKKLNCYKVILNCDPSNIKFYEKCGFTQKNVQMALYFD